MVSNTSDGLQQTKYENAILYFVQRCNTHYLGATKLNKLLYYLDFLHYRDEGAIVTGDELIGIGRTIKAGFPTSRVDITNATNP